MGAALNEEAIKIATTSNFFQRADGDGPHLDSQGQSRNVGCGPFVLPTESSASGPKPS